MYKKGKGIPLDLSTVSFKSLNNGIRAYTRVDRDRESWIRPRIESNQRKENEFDAHRTKQVKPQP